LPTEPIGRFAADADPPHVHAVQVVRSAQAKPLIIKGYEAS